MEKLPSIGYLYPAPIYMDYTLFRYSSTEANKSLAVIQTDIIDELLPYNLKPNKTYNMEMGIDVNISGINAQITYFKENWLMVLPKMLISRLILLNIITP